MQKGRDEFPEDITHNEPSRTDATELHSPNSLLDTGFAPSPQPNTTKPASQQKPRHTSTLKDMRFLAEYWQGNQQDFLERSPTWGPFTINKNSAVQQDLERRVPLVGLSDINIQKKEVPLRILRKRHEEIKARKTWLQIWHEGKAERGENIEGQKWDDVKDLGAMRRP